MNMRPKVLVRKLRVLQWENHHGPVKMLHVLPLVMTHEQLCAQFYRVGMKKRFRMERLMTWRRGFHWVRTVPKMKV